MRIELLGEAEHEVEEAFDWYYARNPDAAVQFLLELDTAYQRIAIHPSDLAKLDDRHRYCQLRRYPYLVISRALPEHEKVIIVAVAHTSRRPGYWGDRG